MIKQIPLLLTLLTILLTGCGLHPNQVRKRAAFEFQCSEKKITIEKLGSKMTSASGCQQQATYVESCEIFKFIFDDSDKNPSRSSNCTWSRQGSSN